MDIVFVPKGGTFPTENHHACCEKHIPNLPQMGQNLYHDMLMPFHDSMRSFINFRRVFDLLEFKNHVSQRFVGNQQCPCVWNSFPFLARDLSMHPRTPIWFFNQFKCTGACACQIWIMHINALKTQLMHKNIQTNPEKSQKFTQHYCYSMLTREKILKAIRGNGYRFVPKGDMFPTETITLVVRS